ncbi:MAG: hypothetical protein R3Y43_08205 [Alphaproteobacteria bacterium]
MNIDTNTKFDPEDKVYKKYIPIDTVEYFREKCSNLNKKLKTAIKQRKFSFDDSFSIDINDLTEIKEFLSSEPEFNLNDAFNHRRASFFLVSCFFAKDPEVIEFLLNQEIDINLVDLYGYNCLMSLIMNENMQEKDKLSLASTMIDKGIYINWRNFESAHALTMCLETMQVDLAELLIDKGAVVYV